MKTLVEIEPRVPIHAADLPLTIVTPGSYYLAENAQSATSKITIAANHVSIDLSGFTLGSSTVGAPIVAPSAIDDVTIRNGSIVGSDQTINLGLASGVSLDQLDVTGPQVYLGVRAHVSRSRVHSNGGWLFSCGDQCIVEDSQFSGFPQGAVLVGNHSLVTKVVIINGQGLSVGNYSVVAHSLVFSDDRGIVPSTSGGAVTISDCDISGSGDEVIVLGDDVRLINSHVTGGATHTITLGSRSLVQGVTVLASGRPLFVGDESVVRDSLVHGGGIGIAIGSGSTVVGNTCTDAGGAGISVSGSGNRIEGNSFVRNNVGLLVGGTGNTILRNSASQNTGSNYQIASGNDVGPIGTAAAATSPWANISF
jgi:parallel beta-helix repeat protein